MRMKSLIVILIGVATLVVAVFFGSLRLRDSSGSYLANSQKQVKISAEQSQAKTQSVNTVGPVSAAPLPNQESIDSVFREISVIENLSEREKKLAEFFRNLGHENNLSGFDFLGYLDNGRIKNVMIREYFTMFNSEARLPQVFARLEEFEFDDQKNAVITGLSRLINSVSDDTLNTWINLSYKNFIGDYFNRLKGYRIALAVESLQELEGYLLSNSPYVDSLLRHVGSSNPSVALEGLKKGVFPKEHYEKLLTDVVYNEFSNSPSSALILLSEVSPENEHPDLESSLYFSWLIETPNEAIEYIAEQQDFRSKEIGFETVIKYLESEGLEEEAEDWRTSLSILKANQ